VTSRSCSTASASGTASGNCSRSIRAGYPRRRNRTPRFTTAGETG
jgi:hypothetical protein